VKTKGQENDKARDQSVGERPRRNLTMNNPGYVKNLQRYYVNCPRGTFATAVRGLPDDRGIIPDIIVEPSVKDLINGRDPMMEVAFEMIDSLILR
jgi:hypothetical protein